MSEHKVIDLRKAGDILGMKANTVYKWAIYKKAIPYIDYGVSIRFYERDVIKYRDDHYVNFKEDIIED